jgi:hypothetical protein
VVFVFDIGLGGIASILTMAKHHDLDVTALGDGRVGVNFSYMCSVAARKAWKLAEFIDHYPRWEIFAGVFAGQMLEFRLPVEIIGGYAMYYCCSSDCEHRVAHYQIHLAECYRRYADGLGDLEKKCCIIDLNRQLTRLERVA